MINADDAFSLIDRLAAWLPEKLEWLPENVRNHLVVPLVIAVILLVPRVVVHRVLPWAGRFLVVPLVVLVTGLLAAAGVLTDFLLALAFRLLSIPLTGLHFAIGDWTISGTRGARVTTRYRVFRAGQWLSRFSPLVLLLVGVAVTLMWNAGYCDRNPSVGCTDPLGQWGHEIWELCRSVWDELSRPAL